MNIHVGIIARTQDGRHIVRNMQARDVSSAQGGENSMRVRWSFMFSILTELKCMYQKFSLTTSRKIATRAVSEGHCVMLTTTVSSAIMAT